MPSGKALHVVGGGFLTTSADGICRHCVVVLYDSRSPRYPRGRMARTPFEDLLHRVNNLLGTIEIQAELAAAEDTLQAHRSAMAQILASARRAAEEVVQLRARNARGE